MRKILWNIEHRLCGWIDWLNKLLGICGSVNHSNCNFENWLCTMLVVQATYLDFVFTSRLINQQKRYRKFQRYAQLFDEKISCLLWFYELSESSRSQSFPICFTLWYWYGENTIKNLTKLKNILFYLQVNSNILYYCNRSNARKNSVNRNDVHNL